MTFYVVWQEGDHFRAATAEQYHESTEDGLLELTSPELIMYGTGEYHAGKLIQFIELSSDSRFMTRRKTDGGRKQEHHS